MSFIGVYRALYAYTPQSAEELTIDENDILYLLETSDVDDWWTVKKRVVGADAEEPVGLVPSNYIEPAEFIGTANALYDYDRQTEEELTFKEGDKFQVYDDKDPDWILVGKNNQEFGFVPSNYIEMSLGGANAGSVAPPPSHPSQEQAAPPQQPTQPISSFQPPPKRFDSPRTAEPQQQVQQPPQQPSTSSYAPPPQPQTQPQHTRDRSYDDYSDEESAPPPKPSRPSTSNASLPAPPAEDEDEDDQLYTWAISEVDGRKKKKAMLAIGNSTIYFSPDSNNGTPHQWKAKDLLSFSSEKKHVFMEFRNPLYSLEIHSGTKEVAAEILSILGELKGSFASGGLKEIQAAASSKPPSKSLPFAKKTGKIMYDFEAQGDDELTVREGDNVYIINDKKSKDWWMVELINSGRNGVVPAQFVVPDQQESGLSSLTSKFKRSKSKESLSTSSPAKKEQQQQKKLQGPKPSRIRTWEDASGTFKVDAEFLGVVEGKVHLHKTNGVKIAVAAPKLSIPDLEYVEKVTGMSLEQYKGNAKKASSNDPDRERRERRERERRRRERDERDRDRAERERDRRERELEREERDRLRQELKEAKTGEPVPPAQPARPGSSSRSASGSKARSSSAPKEEYDWFEFFLEAGVDVNQCQRYTNNFNNEQIDPSIMESIDSSVLRTLGLREGDIIRVNRYLDQKFNRQPKQAEAAQGGLFTEPTGGLKANRTGSATSVGNTLPTPTGSADPGTSGADDDAWTVKPAANSEAANGTDRPASTLTQNFTGSMQDLVNLKPLAPTATASSTRSNQTFAPIPSKPLQPTKSGATTGVSTDTITTQKTGGTQDFISTQPTGQSLAPLDPFKTGGANILPLATGGAFVYLPTQQTGVLNLQPTGALPFQQTSLIPLQKTGGAAGLPNLTGGLPFQQTGLLPLQRTGGNVTGGIGAGALPLQKTGPLGVLPQFGTGATGTLGGASLPPTSFGQAPTTSFGQLPTTSFSSQPTGGLNNFQTTGGLNNFQSTGGLNSFQPTGGLNNFQPTGGLNNFQPTGGFQSQPSTGFSTPFSQPTGGFNSQPTGFGQPSFNQPQQSGFNSISSPPTFNTQQTGFGQQPQLQNFGQQQPFNQQMNQLTNSFQNTSLQNPSPFGQPQPQPSFGGFQQQQPQTSFGGFQQQSQPMAPLESQPTGFGFGNSGGFGQQQQQPLGPQATGKRANLANASADNPFGF